VLFLLLDTLSFTFMTMVHCFPMGPTAGHSYSRSNSNVIGSEPLGSHAKAQSSKLL